MLFGGLDSGGLELRRARDGSHRLHGRFPYGKAAVLSDGGRTGRPRKEIVAARAFAYRVERAEEDVHLLVGHSYDRPLASKMTRTLALQDSDEALNFEATITPQIADTSYGADAIKLIDSGLAVGISPGFRIPPRRRVENAERVEEEPYDPSRGLFAALIRWIFSALLYELSLVTRPAYDEAQIEMRDWQVDESSSLALPRSHALARWRL
jgi:HK97 family phage prohead protease